MEVGLQEYFKAKAEAARTIAPCEDEKLKIRRKELELQEKELKLKESELELSKAERFAEIQLRKEAQDAQNKLMMSFISYLQNSNKN
jgi:hypothetical protein